MKQTNNAIKFLMAQYRAIFQNAYFKGLATAAVVTMGLAAGQAQAAANTAFNGTQTITGDTVTITGDALTDPDSTADHYTKIQVTAANSANQDKNIVISGGTTTDNYIKLGSAATFTAQSLKIEADDAAKGLSIDGTTAKTTANFTQKVDLVKGTLALQGTNGGELTTPTIEFNGAAEDEAVLELTKGTAGTADTTIQFTDEKFGKVAFKGTDATDAVLSGTFSGTGSAALDFSTGKGTISATGTLAKADITVGAAKEASISLAEQSDVLSLQSGKINIAAADGKLSLAKGTLELGSNVVLTNTTAAKGSISVAEGATLQANTSIIKSFMAADGDTPDQKGNVVLSGTWVLTGDNNDLAQIAIGEGASAGGELALGANSLIKGTNVAVSEAITGTATNLKIEADTLTLGKADANSAAVLGGGKATAKDLVLLTKEETGFNLADDITLTTVSGADGAEQADSVTLEEKIALNTKNKGLTINGGNYTANDVTVGAGTLTVTNKDVSVDSTLAINKLVLDNGQDTANGKISVSGAAPTDLDKVVLDLTNTDISYAKTDTSAAKKSITLEADQATIKIAGDKITELLNHESTFSGAIFDVSYAKTDTSAAKKSITLEADQATIKIAGDKITELLNHESTFSGAIFDVKNGGQLLVTEGLELDATTQLKTSGVTTNGIMLGSGKLNVDGELKLSNAKSVSFEKDDHSVTLQAKKLSLNLATGDVANESATLTSGDFIVTEQISTNSDKGIVISDNGLLKLGDKNTSAGNIYANSLKVAGTAQAAQLDVVKGTWSLAGKTELGANGTVNVESGAGLNTQELAVSVAGANFNLKDGAKSNVTKLTATAGKVNVSGTMTVEGAITKSGTTITSHGVQLADDSIQMAATGKLSFGEAATQAITVKKDGVEVFSGSFADSGSIQSVAGSEVSFSFDETTNFTAEALKDLRTKIFGVTGDKLVDGRINLGKATIAGIDENIVDNKISWDKVEGLSDAIGDSTSEKLSQAIVTDVTSSDKIRGHYGAIQSKDTGAINIVGNTSLNNAAANNGMFAQGIDNQPSDFNVATGTLELNNGGQAGKVTLQENTTLQVDGAQTTIEAIEGKKASVLLAQGATTVTNNANIKNFTDDANSSLTVGKKLTLGENLAADQKTTILGSVKAGSADFKADALVKGNLEVTSGDLVASKTFEASGNVKVAGNTTFTGTATLSGQQNEFAQVNFKTGINKIAQGQTFADAVNLASGANLLVGTDLSETLKQGANAYLVTDKLSLNGNTLVIDPSYEVPSSIVVADHLSTIPGMDTKTDAGMLSGNAVVLQNSILALGVDTTDKSAALAAVKSELAPLFKANGALDEKKVGAVAYTAKAITLGSSDQLIVDSERSLSKFKTDATNGSQYANALTTNDLYLGTNSALAVDGAAFSSGKAAITLQDGSKIFAGEGSKVILTGKDAMNADGNKLFGVTGAGSAGLTLNGTGATPTLRVETINGWFYQDLAQADLVNNLNLDIDKTKADKDLEVVSEPVRDTLLSAAYDIHNYDEYLAKKADGTWDEATMAQDVLGVVAPSNITYNKDTQQILENGNDITTNTARLTELGIDVESTKQHGIVYLDATNALLENILFSNGSAVDAETNARLAVFGGAPQAAIEAGASTYEAISARMGVGVSGVSAAANGQGGAIWVTPVYKSAESDGFAADNKSYGADVKLYGLALGADIEVAPNFKVGGMFNVGSGDADGQGLGANVSNDFDYYGLGLYAGYSMDAFSLVADVTYTAVDNDIEGNTDLGKVNASIDSTNLSVGVTGQYKLSLAGMDVTPHAGLRYSMIDMDDYSTAYSQNDSDSINIFSVPVGVTIAKEYVTDTWTVKPSFDLTLTGNFGDDEAESTAKWNGFSNLSTTVKSEIMDNFTYGAAVGVSATTGNFGLGLGVNYTGSSK